MEPDRKKSKGRKKAVTERTSPAKKAKRKDSGRKEKKTFSRDEKKSTSEEEQSPRRGHSKATGFIKGKGRKVQKESLPRTSRKPLLPGSERYKENEPVRLNKYIASAGICSRREADQLIESGKVLVNGKTVTEMGTKIKPADTVIVDGHELKPEEFVYILLNKPKNTISTTQDEKDRKTVLDVIENATGKRVYPVGRLDRNTTGLMLLTNDGELANRLMHPSYRIRKVYQVDCDRILTDEQISSLRNGVELEDGKARAYKADRHPVLANVIRMSIIEGRNHQVKRMIEAVGASVLNLKRIVYAGLEIEGLRNGQWRNLTRKEVFELRQLTQLLDKKTLDL
ncbi:MAG: rRNA pseudouridine synthase [Balneolales bacterium]|nr:rRNA pseudouridine synthase [Balneolales bacterium]